MGAHSLLWLIAGVIAIVSIFIEHSQIALAVAIGCGAVAELVTERD